MKRNEVHIEREDEIFLLHMMEKDDITVISEGLADTINPSLWKYDYIDGCIGSEYHHKFRSFIEGREKDGWYSMKFSDYFRYLERRQVVKKMNSGSGGESTTMVNDINLAGMAWRVSSARCVVPSCRIIICTALGVKIFFTKTLTFAVTVTSWDVTNHFFKCTKRMVRA